MDCFWSPFLVPPALAIDFGVYLVLYAGYLAFLFFLGATSTLIMTYDFPSLLIAAVDFTQRTIERSYPNNKFSELVFFLEEFSFFGYLEEDLIKLSLHS